MMLSRRTFLSRGGLISVAPAVPSFLVRSLAAAQATNDDGRILVVIQLDGGNDGLNTVVPHADDAYFRQRPQLNISPDNVILVNDTLGLHTAMQPFAGLLEDDRAAIVQGVGYPNPNRSHFRSMAIWHTGSTDDNLPDHGWIGRATDAAASGSTDMMFVGDEQLPVCLRGRRAVATSMMPGKKLELTAKLDPTEIIQDHDSDGLKAFVQRNLLDAYTAARQMNVPQAKSSGAIYPGNKLGVKLKTIAQLMQLNSTARVYYAIQSGYDTHENQLGTHSTLLSEFASAVKAFMDEIRDLGLEDRVLLMAFSEFGRRVGENGSQGTDHGTAGPVFLAGTPVRAGFHGPAPDLNDLDRGDLKAQFDFRQVYATLLEDWLGLSPEQALGQAFEKLPILAA